MRRRFWILFLLAPAALAQQRATGDLSGWVFAADSPLAGVTVVATSPALQGERVATSGENGGFLLPFLPPGSYELRFERVGFTPLRQSVRVALGAVARLEVRLHPEPVREELIVTAHEVEVSHDASIGRSFPGSELQRLPIRRDLRSIALLSPAVAGESSLMISGAPSWDGLFLVDGIAVGEYQSGQPHPILFEDVIQEAVVLTGAISAEYGRFTGGVVHAVTRSGGNEIAGTLRDTLTNAAWEGRSRPGEEPPLDRTNHALEGTFGGFILRDRLWFFLAGRDARASARLSTVVTLAGYRSDSDDRRAEMKLTARLSQRHTLVGTYIARSLTETNVTHPRTNGRVIDIGALIPERRRPIGLFALSASGVFPGQWFGEVQYSANSAPLQANGGTSNDRLLGTVLLLRGLDAAGNAPFGCGICGDDRRESRLWSAKATHYRNTRWGNHTVVAGAEEFVETRQNRGTRSASEFTIQAGTARVVGDQAFPLFGPGTLIAWTSYHEGERGHELGTTGIFVNDRWDVHPRLTLNLGIRWDDNGAKDPVGRVVSDDEGLSPRLGAAFDLDSRGRHRLFASYGRYAAKILEGGGANQQVGVFDQLAWIYRGPEINSLSAPPDELISTREAVAMVFAWFDSVGGTRNRTALTFYSNPESSGEFSETLASPAVDEISLGYSLQLSSGSVRLDYVSRDWTNFYAAQVDTTTGQRENAFGFVQDVIRIVNDDRGTNRTYRALQIDGTLRHGPFAAGGGYVISKLRGNDEGEEGFSAVAPRNLPRSLWYPEYLGYPSRSPTGYLRHDQRHRARVWLTWGKDLGRVSLHLAALQRFESGKPYSAVADIDPTGRSVPFAGIPSNPGYALNQTTIVPYFFSERGAFRADDVWSTDVAMLLEIGGRVRPFGRIDVFNLFDHSAVIAPNTEVLTRYRAGVSSGLQAFNPFIETPLEGVHYTLGPNFGKPTGPEAYQAPRTVQISLGLRF